MPKTNSYKEESTYLKKLRFDPKLLTSSITRYLRNPRLVILVVLTIIVLGSFAYTNLPRTVNPEIKIPLVIVTTVLPGAGPNDVESLITIPLEDPIRSIAKVKTVSSTSRDSVSIITAEFESGVDPDKAQADVKGAVDSVIDLPADTQTPNVLKLDFENQPVWTFSLAGPDLIGAVNGDPVPDGNVASLMRLATSLKQDLENIPTIDKVTISGLEEQEVQILLKSQSLTTYSLNPQQLVQAIKTSLKSLPAGAVKAGDSSFPLSIDPAIASIEDLRNIKINLGGSTVVSLSDVAAISEHSKPNQNQSHVLASGKPISRAISFNIYRAQTSRIDQTIADAQKAVNQKLANYNGRFHIYSVTNIGDILSEQFHDLQRDFLLIVLLVSIILLVFLGIRQAAVSIWAIPLTFLITFIIMNLTGISLSFISQFSLLLSLGLLVDDTIVVISAMSSYYRSGKFTPLQTGLLVWKDFWVPIFTTTITTVWAFLPLLLSAGIIGNFIRPIPIVVSSTLLASFFVAMFITLPFIVFLLRPKLPLRVLLLIRLLGLSIILILFYLLLPKNNIILLQVLALLIFLFVVVNVRSFLADRVVLLLKRRGLTAQRWQLFTGKITEGVISFQQISAYYKRVIFSILASHSARRKTIFMVIIFSLFSYLLFPLGFVRNEFFPKEEGDYLFISIEYPAGTNLEQTRNESLKVLDQLKDTPKLKFVSMDIGRAFTSTQGFSEGSTNNVLFSVRLEEKKGSMEIAQKLREKFSSYTKGKLAVQEVSGGPPAGADLQIKLFGPDLAILDKYAKQIQNYLSKQPGVTNTDKTIKPGTSKLVFIPDQVKLTQNGLSQDVIGFWLRFFASGITADKIQLENGSSEKKDINLRQNSQVQDAASINSIMIPTQTSGILPISALGKIRLEPNPVLITREDGKRTLSVIASVAPTFSISTLNRKLEDYANSLNLPADYAWATGGINEENQKSVNSILQAMALSFLLIIATMVIQFTSFRKALIVMLVIPLSISGVFIIFALTRTPLSFPALIGILALFGIVVKNSILLVDKIIANIRSGLEFTESIADASASRLEPIALTSLTAIFGLIPITLSSPLWQGLGGAIIAGLTFSGTIMLFFIPVVYYLIFNKEEGKSLK